MEYSKIVAKKSSEGISFYGDIKAQTSRGCSEKQFPRDQPRVLSLKSKPLATRERSWSRVKNSVTREKKLRNNILKLNQFQEK